MTCTVGDEEPGISLADLPRLPAGNFLPRLAASFGFSELAVSFGSSYFYRMALSDQILHASAAVDREFMPLIEVGAHATPLLEPCKLCLRRHDVLHLKPELSCRCQSGHLPISPSILLLVLSMLLRMLVHRCGGLQGICGNPRHDLGHLLFSRANLLATFTVCGELLARSISLPVQ